MYAKISLQFNKTGFAAVAEKLKPKQVSIKLRK